MEDIKPCSGCNEAPDLAEFILPHTIDNPKAVIKFQVICFNCVEKSLTDPSLYFATFAWNKKAVAIADWNDAVNNKNKKDGLA